MNLKYNVLLLDGHTVQCISVAKSLKELSNVHLTVFCELKISYGYTSRYPDQKLICPTIKNDNSKYLKFLISFLKNNQQDVIIPLFNDSAELLSKNKTEIERSGVKVAIPSFDLFVKAHNKEMLMELCKENGLPHPRTAGLSKMNIEKAAEYVGFPSLIKPNFSSGALGIKYVNNLNELKNKYKTIEKEFGDSTLQEYVNHSGVYYNVMLFRYENGDYSHSVAIKIIRYFPVKGGTGSYCIVIENQELVDICKKTLDCMNWHGFADFDIIQDINKNGFKIIEINPRIPASIHAAYISNINFPEIILRDCLGLSKPVNIFKAGRKLRYLSMDVLWFIFSNERFKAKPSWFKFFEKDLHFQEGSISDPIPIFAGIIMGIKKYMNPEFCNRKLRT